MYNYVAIKLVNSKLNEHYFFLHTRKLNIFYVQSNLRHMIKPI